MGGSNFPLDEETMPLTEEQISIIEATAPVVAAHSLDITKAFYPHMFAENPEVFEFFNRANQATGKQPRALADALVGYASNIRRLEALGSAVERMVHTMSHCKFLRLATQLSASTS